MKPPGTVVGIRRAFTVRNSRVVLYVDLWSTLLTLLEADSRLRRGFSLKEQEYCLITKNAFG